jgi:hypothetical protein
LMVDLARRKKHQRTKFAIVSLEEGRRLIATIARSWAKSPPLCAAFAS